jgi:hypothetical protein
MDIHVARQIIASVRHPSPVSPFGVGGIGKIASTRVSPRQAGVAIGVSPGTGAWDARIALLVTNPNAQTQAFINQMATVAGQNDLDVQRVGPTSATDPASAPNGSYYQQIRRPLVPGASIGNARENSAGTLGAFVTAEDGTTHVLSNNHVLANSSMVTSARAAIGDAILQPGRRDGGIVAHTIANLSGWIPLDPDTPNFVDCATGATALLPGGAPLDNSQNQKIVMGVREPRVGEPVFKVGRTTGETFGRIVATEAGDYPVNYNGQPVYFDGQMVIQGDDGPFSDRGDSGSLIISRDDRQAVGCCSPVTGTGRSPTPLTRSSPSFASRFSIDALVSCMDRLATRVAHRYIIREACMVDMEQARRAKETLRARLSRPAWLRGVGIGIDASGSHLVRVMVAEMTDEVRRALPPQVDGVPVEVDVTGDFLLQ